MKKTRIVLIVMLIIIMLTACKNKNITQDKQSVDAASPKTGFTAIEEIKEPSAGNIKYIQSFEKGANTDEMQKNFDEGYVPITWVQYVNTDAAKTDYEAFLTMATDNNLEITCQDGDVAIIKTDNDEYLIFSKKENSSLYALNVESKYYDEYINFIKTAEYPVPKGE